MNLRFCKDVLFLCLTPLCAVAGEELTIMHAGQLLAIPGQQVLHEQSILVSDGEIVAVVPGYLKATEVDAGYTQVSVLDLADHFRATAKQQSRMWKACEKERSEETEVSHGS